MARYKGQITPRMNERTFPHLVDIVVPPGGLGARLDAMHDWLRARSIPARHGRGGLNAVRWCFSDPAVADDFARKFDGVRSTAGG